MGKAVPAAGGLLAGLLLGTLIGVSVERTWPATDPSPTPDPTVAPEPAPDATPDPAPAPQPATDGETGQAGPDGADGADGADGSEGSDGTAKQPTEYDHPDHVAGVRIIKGRVVAEDAAVVPGAWVTAAVDYRPVAEMICDKNGEFTIVVPGDMPITLRARARRTSESQTYEVAAQEGTPAVVVLDVRDSGTFHGRVIGSAGDPVAGATITMEWFEPEGSTPPVNDDGEPDLMPKRTTTTDEFGTFAFTGCWPGSGGGWFIVNATHPRHYEQSLRVDVPDPYRLHEPFGGQLTLLDAAGGVANGTLKFPDGRPVRAGYVMGMVRDGREIKEWKRFDVQNGAFEIKFGRAGSKAVLVPMVNGKAGIPHTIHELDEAEGAPAVDVVFTPAPPLLTGRLIPPPGGGLLETKFGLEITSGQIASPVANPAVRFDEVSGEFSILRQFFGVEGGAAYGTLAIKAPGCKTKILDFNAYDGETEELGDIQLEGE